MTSKFSNSNDSYWPGFYRSFLLSGLLVLFRCAASVDAGCSINGAIQTPEQDKVKLHYWSMAKPQNIVGPQIRKLRYQQGLTQELFAARCSVLGLELSRGTLSKIEAQLRCVTDTELIVLAKALKVEATALLSSPNKGRSRQT